MRDVAQGKAVGLGERDDDIVLGGGGLDLEIELAAEALAQRQPPGAVDAAAVGRVHDELRAAGLIEETFEDDRGLGRQAVQSGVAGAQIVDDLLGRHRVDGEVVDEPAQH